MLTNTMPSLGRTLQGQFPDALIRNLMQTLGNCNQPLSHRNSLTLLPNFGRNDRGMYNGQQWDPNLFRDIPPQGNSFIDGSFTYNGSPFYQIDGDNILLQSEINNSLNQTFGGPTMISLGDTIFDNTFHNDITTNNINTTNINNAPAGQPLQGPAGPPGQAGAAGAPGTPAGPVGFPGPGGFPTEGFRLRPIRVMIGVDTDATDVAQAINTKSESVVKNLSSDSTSVAQTVSPTSGTALTGATFNATSCAVDTGGGSFLTGLSSATTSVVASVTTTPVTIVGLDGDPGRVNVVRQVSPQFATILVLARG